MIIIKAQEIEDLETLRQVWRLRVPTDKVRARLEAIKEFSKLPIWSEWRRDCRGLWGFVYENMFYHEEYVYPIEVFEEQEDVDYISSGFHPHRCGELFFFANQPLRANNIEFVRERWEKLVEALPDVPGEEIEGRTYVDGRLQARKGNFVAWEKPVYCHLKHYDSPEYMTRKSYENYGPVGGLLGCETEKEVQPGVYLSGLNSGLDRHERIIPSYGEEADDYLSYWGLKPSMLYLHGVADNVEQIIEYSKYSQPGNDYCITFTVMRKEDQPEEGGWRWHKWGEYIGDIPPTREYLYDEEVHEEVLVFRFHYIQSEDFLC